MNITDKALAMHVRELHEAISGNYGASILMARLIDAKSNGDNSADVCEDLTKDFILHSLAMLIHHAASKAIDDIEYIERQLNAENENAAAGATAYGVNDEYADGYRAGEPHGRS